MVTGGLGIQVLKYNKIAVLNIMIQLINSNQTVNSSEIIFEVPSGFIPLITVYVDIFIGNTYISHAYMYNGSGEVKLHGSSLITSDFITFNCTYIVA